MKENTRRFRDKFIRERDKIERKGVRMAIRALSDQYKEFVDRAMLVQTDQWITLADTAVKPEPIQIYLEKYYKMNSPLALMQRKHAVGEKAEDDKVYLSIYEQHMLHFLSESAGESIVTITATSKDKIKGIIREVLTQGELDGAGIDEIKRRLVREVGANLRGNAVARAKAIAQTEMIKASNEASKFAIDSTGLEYRKFWSSSHLPGTRASHTAAEQESITKNGLRKDELFESVGMLYVGDPQGSADNIINCRCSTLYEVV